MGGGASSLSSEYLAKLSPHSIQQLEILEKECKENNLSEENTQISLTEKYYELLAIETNIITRIHSPTKSAEIPRIESTPPTRNRKNSKTVNERPKSQARPRRDTWTGEAPPTVRRVSTAKPVNVPFSNLSMRHHDPVNSARRPSDPSKLKVSLKTSNDEQPQTLLSSASVDLVMSPPIEVVVTPPDVSEMPLKISEPITEVSAVAVPNFFEDTYQQLLQTKTSPTAAAATEKQSMQSQFNKDAIAVKHTHDYHCAICNESFFSHHLLHEHLTQSITHINAINEREARIFDAVKKTRKLEELALIAVNKFKAIFEEHQRRMTLDTDNANFSVEQIRWKKAISEVMSKKLIAQYHALNKELTNVPLVNNKYIKLLHQSSKLFWKIKSRFLFLIYLHLQLNTIEVIIVQLPCQDVLFHSHTHDKVVHEKKKVVKSNKNTVNSKQQPGDKGKTKNKNSTGKVEQMTLEDPLVPTEDQSPPPPIVYANTNKMKRIYLKYPALLELCFGVRGNQISALLSDCLTFDHPSVQISPIHSQIGASTYQANSTVNVHSDAVSASVNNAYYHNTNAKYHQGSTDIHSVHNDKYVGVNTTVEDTIVSFILAHIEIDHRYLLTGVKITTRADMHSSGVAAQQWGDYSDNNNSSVTALADISVVDALYFNDIKLNVCPVHSEIPEGLCPVSVEAGHIYTQWDVKIKLQQISEGKSQYLNKEVNREIRSELLANNTGSLINGPAVLNDSGGEGSGTDKDVNLVDGITSPHSTSSSGRVRRWSFVM